MRDCWPHAFFTKQYTTRPAHLVLTSLTGSGCKLLVLSFKQCSPPLPTIASRPFGEDQSVVSVLISLASDIGTTGPNNVELIFVRGHWSGACSGLVTGWPGIAVLPGDSPPS